MLNPEKLRAMSPEVRTQLFESLGAAFYGSPHFVPRLSDDFDVSKATVHRWKKDHNTPWAVIFALDRWVNSPEMADKTFQDWREISAQLSEASRSMGKVALTLSQAVLRHSAVIGDEPAS